MRTKTKAWDNLRDQNNDVFQYGYQLDKIPLTLEHARTSLEQLYTSQLSIDQVDSLSELIYYVYRLGRDSTNQ